jgi:hypothetical protein
MAANAHRLGWVGMGRMGYPMAERLLAAGHDLSIWNRPRAKAEPLAAKGAQIVDRPADLADVDVRFTMVSTGKDLGQILFGDQGVAAHGDGAVPGIVVDCSSIGVDHSAAFRERLGARGTALIAAPVSGNGKCVKAGKLSAVASGPEPAYRAIGPYLEAIAGRGVSYVGEGERARRHAGGRRHARSAAGAFRQREPAERSPGLSRQGFCGLARDRRTAGRDHARERQRRCGQRPRYSRLMGYSRLMAGGRSQRPPGPRILHQRKALHLARIRAPVVCEIPT